MINPSCTSPIPKDRAEAAMITNGDRNFQEHRDRQMGSAVAELIPPVAPESAGNFLGREAVHQRERLVRRSRIHRRPQPQKPPVISAAGSRTFGSSGISVMVASVSNSVLATLTAFSRPTRTTLVGSTIPASSRST